MSNHKNLRPEWVPDNAGDGFATEIIKGDTKGDLDEPRKRVFKKKKELSVEAFAEGIKANNRTILAQAITLVESNAAKHINKAQDVLSEILPCTGNSIRIGVTGVPGAGKSTFIEVFGTYLCELGHKVAVLAVDPSSSITGGSILGDKTRMELLSNHPNAFVRPTPSSGTLGGVSRKTRETVLLCEAAGYDVILIETIGVGQSEIVVRSMVDFFMLLALTGAGDELQGMKKGVMELADAILINKADGDNKEAANLVKREFNQLLHYLRPATEQWETKAFTVSALEKEGINEIWEVIQSFKDVTTRTEEFAKRRQSQTKDWMNAMIKDYLESSFFNHPLVNQELNHAEIDMMNGKETVMNTVRRLISLYEGSKYN